MPAGTTKGLSGRPLETFGSMQLYKGKRGFRSCGSDQGFPVTLDLRKHTPILIIIFILLNIELS